MELEIDIGRDSEWNLLSVQWLVDGSDLLPAPLRGVDPDWVLPPLSAALLPSSLGRSAMIGTCCEPGCGSFSVQVRRVGASVLWEPDPHALDETVSAVLEFSLLPYLEAVDAAASDPQLHDRGRRLARAVELALVRQHEKYGLGEREVLVPMSWQSEGEVALLYRGQRHVLPVADLPDDDDEAVRAVCRLASDPEVLPPTSRL